MLGGISLHTFILIVESEGGVISRCRGQDWSSGGKKPVCSNEKLNVADPEGGQVHVDPTATLFSRIEQEDKSHKEEVSEDLLGFSDAIEEAT